MTEQQPRRISEEHKRRISEARRKTVALKKLQQDPGQAVIPEDVLIETDVDLSLWKSAIEEDLIERILNNNLLTAKEIDKIKKDLEAGKKPPDKLMDKFSIAIARIA